MVESQPTQAETKSEDRKRRPGPLHLHAISDSKSESLAAISQNVREQHKDGQIVEHVHSSVRNRRQLRRALRDIESAPGIVIHCLSKQELGNELEEFCKRVNVPCFAAPMPHSEQPAKTSRWFRAAILLPLALLMIWAVVTQSVLAYKFDADTEAAPEPPTTSAGSLVNLAEAKLNPIRKRFVEHVAEKDQEGIRPSSGSEQNDSSSFTVSSVESRSLAESRSLLDLSLRKDPLNVRALKLSGQLAELQGDEQRRDQFMQAAVRRSLHVGYPAYWMLVKSYEDQNFSAAIRYADILLRGREGSKRNVVPILAKIAEIPEAGEQIKQLLSDNPPWRSNFFGRISRSISDARTPLNLFLELENSSAPSTAEERSHYIEFLLDRGFYDLAYYTWLQFLPPDQLNSLGSLFNGNFETRPTGAPFDWDLSSQAGVIVDVADHPDQDGQALFMKFGPGRVDFAGLKQLVVLPPGTYQLKGMHRAAFLSKNGLFWQVTCVKSRAPIGRGPAIVGRDKDWSSFSFSFTVPDVDCPAQYVQLTSAARSASEQFMSGSIWFDDLQISRESKAESQL